jgi:hypothetical protein
MVIHHYAGGMQRESLIKPGFGIHFQPDEQQWQRQGDQQQRWQQYIQTLQSVR